MRSLRLQWAVVVRRVLSGHVLGKKILTQKLTVRVFLLKSRRPKAAAPRPRCIAAFICGHLFSNSIRWGIIGQCIANSRLTLLCLEFWAT